jgi:hypothetical protein
MKTLAIGLVLAFAPACLGDDPDHLDPARTGGIQSPKRVAGVPDALHNRLLSQIGTVSHTVAGAHDWASQLDAPELCSDCTVTLVHHVDGGLHDVTVYDDSTDVSLCTISVSAGGVIDACGR